MAGIQCVDNPKSFLNSRNLKDKYYSLAVLCNCTTPTSCTFLSYLRNCIKLRFTTLSSPKMTPLILYSIIFAFFAVAAGAAYASGVLDSVIGEITKYVLKAKAEAEVQGLKTQGLQEGQDFRRGNCGL